MLERYRSIGSNTFHRNCIGTAFYLLGLKDNDCHVQPFDASLLFMDRAFELSAFSVDGGLVVTYERNNRQMGRVKHMGVTFLHGEDWSLIHRPRYDVPISDILPLDVTLTEMLQRDRKFRNDLEVSFFKFDPLVYHKKRKPFYMSSEWPRV